MKTIFDKSTTEALAARFQNITTESSAEWGKMNARDRGTLLFK